jgi:hypothetical protein
MSGYVSVLAVGGVAGLTLGILLRVLDNKPLRQIRRAREDFQKIVRRRLPSAEVTTWGGKDVHPVFWIKTRKDDERDQLKRDQLVPDSGLTEDFRTTLLHAGYPAIDIPLAQFVVESQETVDRDYAGSWVKRQNDWHRRRYN